MPSWQKRGQNGLAKAQICPQGSFKALCCSVPSHDPSMTAPTQLPAEVARPG